MGVSGDGDLPVRRARAGASLKAKAIDHVREARGGQRVWAVLDAEVKVRVVAVAAVPEQADHLARSHPLPGSDPDRVRLHVCVEDVLFRTDLDDGVVAGKLGGLGDGRG